MPARAEHTASSLCPEDQPASAPRGFRLAVVGLGLALGVAVPSAARAQATPAVLQGTWKIERILPTGNPACWDAERAATLLGSTLRYGPHALTWQGGTVPVAEALSRRVTAADWLVESRVPFAELGLHAAAATEIDLQHEDADITGATTEVPGDTVLVLGPNRIVVSACGVYYRALRVRR